MKLLSVQRWLVSQPIPGEAKTKSPNAIFNSCCKQDVRVIVWKSHLPTEKNNLNWGCLFFGFFVHGSLTTLLPPFLTGLETVISSWVLFLSYCFFKITWSWIRSHCLLFNSTHTGCDCQASFPCQVSRSFCKHRPSCPLTPPSLWPQQGHLSKLDPGLWLQPMACSK